MGDFSGDLPGAGGSGKVICTGAVVMGLGSFEPGVLDTPLLGPSEHISEPVMGFGVLEPGVLGTPFIDPLGRVSERGDMGSRERWFIARVRETSRYDPRALFVAAARKLDQSEM